MNRRRFFAVVASLFLAPLAVKANRNSSRISWGNGDFIQGCHYPIGDYGFGGVPMRPFGPPEVRISKLSELFPRKLSKKSNEG